MKPTPGLVRFTAAAIIASAQLFLPIRPADAAVFNPHYVISDEELRRADSLSFEEIRLFLAEKGGLNSAYDVDPADGLLKSSAELIAAAAKRYRVNPKYILALIEKESSAVTSAAPAKRQLDWATGFALCDGCSRTDALPLKYRGLGRQIDAGAGWVDWYFKNAGTAAGLKRAGASCEIDGARITPLNAATAALYTYTPHLHGNRLLWSIWNKWFGEGLSPDLPDGALVRNEKTGAVAVMRGGKFRPIANASVLATRFNSRNIIDLNRYDFEALEKTRGGRPLKFADLTLARTESGDVYLLAGEKRRRIASPQVFSKIGFNPEEIEQVAAEDLADYPEGPPITAASTHLAGDLLQDSASGGVYFVSDGVKHPLLDKALLKANFPGRKPAPRPRRELEALKTGEPVVFADGTLLKTAAGPAVYVISGGKKRAIPSEDVFIGLGYDWKNVLTVSKKALDLHETGAPLPSLASAGGVQPSLK